MGSGKSQASGEMPQAMQNIIKGFEEETRDLRGDLVSSFTEALSGNVPGAGIPIVARAEEASRRATATGLKETGTQLAQRGLAGTPFGEQILSQQRQTGLSATAGVAPQILQQMLQLATGYATGQASAVSGALGGTRETQSQAKSWQI